MERVLRHKMDISGDILKNHLFPALLSDEYDVNLKNLGLVCSAWSSFFRDINKVFPVVRALYPELFPSGLCEAMLKNNDSLINKETAKELNSLEFQFGYQNYREMQMFIQTYNAKTWKHMKLPGIEKVTTYERQNNRCMFNSLTILGNHHAFSYLYKLMEESDQTFTFSPKTFDHIANNRKMSVKFIRWIIRERPKAMEITMSGVKKLIENGFPAKDVRELVLNPEKYSIIFGDDGYDNFSRSVCTKSSMISMACLAYWWGSHNEHEIGFSQKNRDEYRFYHRLASNKDVHMHLVWALNGARRYGDNPEEYYNRQVEFVYFIDAVIEENSDVKSYDIYSCYDYYESSRPYKFIKYL